MSPSTNRTAARRIALATKRALDVAVAALVLLVIWPLLLVVALAVRLAMGSPVIFRHVRPGYRGQPFELLKFRSMLAETDAKGVTLTPAERVTAVGRLLRRTSVDELPQLWNVLKGEMSLVGPRPLLMEYLPRYSPEQARRHEMKPGITGLAQVRGRHLLEFDERFRLDTWYVDNWSLRLDLEILVLTAMRVVRGSGIPPGTVDEYKPNWDS